MYLVKNLHLSLTNKLIKHFRVSHPVIFSLMDSKLLNNSNKIKTLFLKEIKANSNNKILLIVNLDNFKIIYNHNHLVLSFLVELKNFNKIKILKIIYLGVPTANLDL